MPLDRALLCTGGVLATKQDIRPYPTRTNQIPRHIPPPHWASHPWVLFLAAGLLPYGTLFVELYFAMTSIWQVRSSTVALPFCGAESVHCIIVICDNNSVHCMLPIISTCCTLLACDSSMAKPASRPC